MVPLPLEDDVFGVRKNIRQACAVSRFQSRLSHSAVMLDISECGICLRVPQGLFTAGDPIWVHLQTPKLAVPGTVRWTLEESVGIEVEEDFADALAFEALFRETA